MKLQLLCHMSLFSPIKLDIPNDLKRVEDANIFLIIYRPNFLSQVIRKDSYHRWLGKRFLITVFMWQLMFYFIFNHYSFYYKKAINLLFFPRHLDYHWITSTAVLLPQHGCWSSTLYYLFCLLVFQWQENMVRLQYMWPSPITWMLVINSLLSIWSIGLPVARKHDKITVHVTLPHNMDVGHQLSIIYFVYWSSSGKKTW